MAIERVNVNTDGTLDEIVGTGRFHLEQLNDGCWFLELDGVKMTLGVNRRSRATVTAIPLDLHHEKDWARWEEGRNRPPGLDPIEVKIALAVQSDGQWYACGDGMACSADGWESDMEDAAEGMRDAVIYCVRVHVPRPKVQDLNATAERVK